tara:strand:+ start:103 stop:558 length:456 start_codon:yes stop_codon:yes gene_type:complete
MKITDLIKSDSIFFNSNASSQSSIFKEISNIISQKTKVSSNLILRKINEREKLGSTAIGEGIAIPHAKIKGIKKTLCFLFKLDNSITYDDSESRKVDLIFVIIAPPEFQSEHLLALSTISSFIKKGENKSKLRKLKSADDVYKLMTNTSGD